MQKLNLFQSWTSMVDPILDHLEDSHRVCVVCGHHKVQGTPLRVWEDPLDLEPDSLLDSILDRDIQDNLTWTPWLEHRYDLLNVNYKRVVPFKKLGVGIVLGRFA